MALQAVRQENCTGCFLAALATLLGKTYQEVFDIFYPGRSQWDVYNHGFKEMSVEQAAFRALNQVGIKAHRSGLKRFSSYSKKGQHALLIIRWAFAPDLCHTIVFDGEERKFIDPTYGDFIRSDREIRHLQEQLDFGILIDKIPEVQHESQRRLGDGSPSAEQPTVCQCYYEGYWEPDGF